MDEIKKQQGKFLVEWARKSKEYNNPSFPISIRYTEAGGMVIIGVGDGTNESNGISINKKDKETWLNFFDEFVNNGYIMINNRNYEFASENFIDIILEAAKTGQ